MPTIVDEAPEVVIHEERNSEGKTDHKGYEENLHDIEIDRKVMVENVYKK